MAWTIKGTLTGLDQSLKLLQGLKQGVRNRILRAALSKATTPMLKTAKRLAPVETGLLRKSIGRKVKTYASTGSVVVVIGPRTGFRREVTVRGRKMIRNPVKYAHLVELGHGGPSPAPAHPFLRPAWDNHKAQAQRIVAAEIVAGIEREAAKGTR